MWRGVVRHRVGAPARIPGRDPGRDAGQVPGQVDAALVLIAPFTPAGKNPPPVTAAAFR